MVASSLDVHLGIDPDDTAVLGRTSSCSVRSTPPDDDPVGEGVATLTVYGCAEGSGTVELRTYPLGPNSRLLASVTITVRSSRHAYAYARHAHGYADTGNGLLVRVCDHHRHR